MDEELLLSPKSQKKDLIVKSQPIIKEEKVLEESPYIKDIKMITPDENPFHVDLPNMPRQYTEEPVPPQEVTLDEVKSLSKFLNEVQIE